MWCLWRGRCGGSNSSTDCVSNTKCSALRGSRVSLLPTHTLVGVRQHQQWHEDNRQHLARQTAAPKCNAKIAFVDGWVEAQLAGATTNSIGIGADGPRSRSR